MRVWIECEFWWFSTKYNIFGIDFSENAALFKGGISQCGFHFCGAIVFNGRGQLPFFLLTLKEILTYFEYFSEFMQILGRYCHAVKGSVSQKRLFGDLSSEISFLATLSSGGILSCHLFYPLKSIQSKSFENREMDEFGSWLKIFFEDETEQLWGKMENAMNQMANRRGEGQLLYFHLELIQNHF